MKKNSPRLLYWSLLLGLLTPFVEAIGQDKTPPPSKNQMESMEVEILRDRRVILPDINRSFDKIPPRAIESKRTPLQYRFESLSFPLPQYKPQAHPMRLKNEEPERVYGNFVSLGFGTYISPYLEAAFSNKRSEKYTYGVHLKHRSFIEGPVRKQNSGFFDTKINAYGSLYGKTLNTGVDIGYENRVGYFYGYGNRPVKRDTTQQVYHRVWGLANFYNAKQGLFNYKADVGFSHLASSSRYKVRESDLHVMFDGNYRIGERGTVLLTSDYSLIVRTDQVVKDTVRHLFKFNPAFRFLPIPSLVLIGGINLSAHNDPRLAQPVYVYPRIYVGYTILKNLAAYLDLTGGLEKVSLHTLVDENFWIDPKVSPRHTDHSFEFSAGLRAKVLKNLGLEFGFSRVGLRSWYMYTPSLADSTKFSVVYDNVERLNVFAAAEYKKDEVMTLVLRADYFQYNPTKETNPWYKPTYRIAFHSFFNIYRKITARLDFIGQGGMYGQLINPSDKNKRVVSVAPALELALRVDYLFSKRLSAFLKLENVLFASYPLYLGYPSRGLQALVGINWTF